MIADKELVRAFQKLLRATALEEIMKIVGSAARNTLRADGAIFVLRDNDYCFFADENSIEPILVGKRIPLESCISGWAMLHKEVVIIEDVSTDQRTNHDLIKNSFVTSLLVVPVNIEDPVGAISVYWKNKYIPTQDDINNLEELTLAACAAMKKSSILSSLENKVSELSVAEKIKDNFLMTVSHELRTPLNAILGWAQILREGDVGKNELEIGLESIERNSRGQAAIIENLLDCSQFATGKIQLNLVPVDLVSIVETTLNAMFFEARKKNLSFSFTCPHSTIFVLGDADRLEKIYTSLLLNAVKFSENHQKIRVSLQKKGEFVEFKVVDEGVGIAKDFLPHVFERFRQADSSLTRKYGGLGLGLSLVQHLVDAHHGLVVAESDGHGKGATFTVTLPLAKEKNMNQRNVTNNERGYSDLVPDAVTQH